MAIIRLFKGSDGHTKMTVTTTETKNMYSIKCQHFIGRGTEIKVKNLCEKHVLTETK